MEFCRIFLTYSSLAGTLITNSVALNLRENDVQKNMLFIKLITSVKVIMVVALVVMVVVLLIVLVVSSSSSSSSSSSRPEGCILVKVSYCLPSFLKDGLGLSLRLELYILAFIKVVVNDYFTVNTHFKVE
jgi:hypothetical protein